MIQHGFTVQRTGDADLDKLQQRIKAALDSIVASATTSQLADDGQWVTVDQQLLQNGVPGPDVASSNIINVKGSYVHLTGTTGTNYIYAANWFNGARIELLVVNGVTFGHNLSSGSPKVTYPLHLLSGAATAKAAGTVIAFRRDDALLRWVQVS